MSGEVVVKVSVRKSIPLKVRRKVFDEIQVCLDDRIRPIIAPFLAPTS